MSEKKEFLDQINQEVDKTIEEIYSSEYEYPDPLTRKHWIGVVVVLIIALMMTIGGFFVL